MKKIKKQEQLQQSLLKGAKTLTDVVSSTLGPRGRNVLLHNQGTEPFVTKDGVTVSKFVVLDDPFENLGAQIIKQVAIETEKTSGDGTTTSTILANSILSQAQKYLAAGAFPGDLKKGIELAVAEVVEQLKANSKPIRSKQDIEDIATISANGDNTIGALIATAVDKIGKDGAITIEEARSLETSLDVIEGFRFNSGFISQQFVTDERRNVVSYKDPLVLVTNHEIEVLQEILPVLQVVAREERPFVIVAEDVKGQTLAALIANVLRGTMRTAAVKAPFYGEERRNALQDLALSIGATFISRESGMKLKEVKLEHLGVVKSFEASRFNTTFIGGKGNYEKIDERTEVLKNELMETDDLRTCERIQERITRLSSGVAVISVGGASELEAVEKKHRIEDALEAVKSAQQEGIIPGGGTTFLKIARDLKVKTENRDQEFGVEIVREAIKKPFECIINNADQPTMMIQSFVEGEEDYAKGHNVATNKIENLLESGVVDPVKVARCALQNAASVAAVLITTNFAVVEV